MNQKESEHNDTDGMKQEGERMIQGLSQTYHQTTSNYVKMTCISSQF